MASAFDYLPACDGLARPADEPWFIEAKDKLPEDEFKRQSTAVAYIRKWGCGVIVWAVPNGTKGSDWQRIRKAREGALAGVPDLTIEWEGGSFFAEMKDGQGMPTPDQRAVLNRLYRLGKHCGVYRRPQTLVAHLRAAGCPVGGSW